VACLLWDAIKGRSSKLLHRKAGIQAGAGRYGLGGGKGRKAACEWLGDRRSSLGGKKGVRTVLGKVCRDSVDKKV